MIDDIYPTNTILSPPGLLDSLQISSTSASYSDDQILQTLINETPINGVLALSRDFDLVSGVVINHQITLDGAGFILNLSGNKTALSIWADNTRVTDLWLNYDTGAAMQSLVGSSPEFDLSGTGISVGNSADHVRIENSKFTGRFRSAVTVTTPEVNDLIIRDSEFQNNYYGVLIDNSGFNSGLRILDNTFLGLKADPICINNPVYVHERNFTNNWGTREFRDGNQVTQSFEIRDNVITDCYGASPWCGLGIAIAGAKNGNVYGNVINGSSYSGIHLEDDAANIWIENNQIFNIRGYQEGENLGWVDSAGAIWIQHSTNIHINDNTIANNADSGIFLVWDSSTHNTDVTIKGNSISNSGDAIRAVGVGIVIMRNYLDSAIELFGTPFDPVWITDSQAW